MRLCLDQGTHSSRALLFDDSANLVAKAQCEVQLKVLDELQVEQDPTEILASLHEVIEKIRPYYPQIKRAGLACQRSSIVCWDRETGQALSPVISWQDRRAVEMIHKLRDQEERIRELTGLPLSPHYGASKIAWCLKQPEIRAALQQGRLICSPLSSFLCHHLCQQAPIVVDPSNASRSLLWSMESGDWADELLTLFQIPREILPSNVANRYAFGNLKQIPECELQVVMGDQNAALFAHGWPSERHIYINMGTGCFVTSPGPVTETGNLLNSLLYRSGENSDIYALEGTVNGGNAALEWFQQQNGEFTMPRESRPHHVLFLNGIGGLGSPFWRELQSRFVGDGDKQHRVLAVMESIVFLIQENIRVIARQRGAATNLLISGGLANHNLFCQMIADLNAHQVQRSQETEATAKGLAFLLGDTTNWPSENLSFEPNSHPALLERYQDWRDSLTKALAT